MWPTYIVYYWEQDDCINDCAGNIVKWKGKARTEAEAKRKAGWIATTKHHTYFRFRNAVQVATLRSACGSAQSA
jgi:hypothetical protein